MRVRLIPQRQPSVIGSEDPQVGDLVSMIREPSGAGLLETRMEHMAVSALNHARANRQAQFERARVVQAGVSAA